MSMVKRLLFILPVLFLVVFVFLFSKPQITCAYDKGSCGAATSICYTNPDNIKDLAPGFACGDASGYKLGKADDNPISQSNANNGVPNCNNGGGVCCDPGSPLSALPPHDKYPLGQGNPACARTSICYTDPPDGKHLTGQQCGSLSGWYYGAGGIKNGEAPGCGLGNTTCCDTTIATPTPPNPCPLEKGLCTKIDTAVGTIDVSGPGGFIQTAFGVLLSISGAVAILLIIFSGYRIMTAQGDSEKLKGAQEMLTSAIIGLLFMIFSVTILRIIGIDILHIPGFK